MSSVTFSTPNILMAMKLVSIFLIIQCPVQTISLSLAVIPSPLMLRPSGYTIYRTLPLPTEVPIPLYIFKG